MINTSFSNNMKYLIILAIIVIGLICYSIDSKPEPIKISHA